MKCLERDDCTDEACLGHCPRCLSNKIGGGGCNGMFCANCSYTWNAPPRGRPFEFTQEMLDALASLPQPPEDDEYEHR